MQSAMLFPPQRHLTFAKFESRPGSVHARSASAQFAMRSGISYQEPILLLAGRPSSGKTHLLHAISNLVKRNTYVHSGITISSQRLAEEVQRANAFGDLHIWRERFASEHFLGIDVVDDIFGHGDVASLLLEVLRLRANAILRTIVSASLSSAPDIPCPLNTFLNHQRAVRLL